MKIRNAFLAIGCLGAVACGSAEEAAPPVPAADPAAAAAAVPAVAAVPAAAVAAVAAAVAGAPIMLAGPGFAATTAPGTAGGPVDGSTLGDGCIGMFPAAPQHTVTVGAAIPMLRVLVNGGAEADTTLAVRRPDGTMACADDSGDPGNGFNPIVELENAPPGVYAVYVGGYSAGDTWSNYNLGFTETAGTFPSAVVANP